jgi:hypothetical protein
MVRLAASIALRAAAARCSLSDASLCCVVAASMAFGAALADAETLIGWVA